MVPSEVKMAPPEDFEDIQSYMYNPTNCIDEVWKVWLSVLLF